MPLWSKGKKDKAKEGVIDGDETDTPNAANGNGSNGTPSANGTDDVNEPATKPHPKPQPKLVFHCQQAHGSPTGVISGFTNVKELYQKIAEAYKISPADILFCTLNTHKVDMSRLLGGQIGLEDFIFAHIKGQPKVVDVNKVEDAIGLTITDNGAGYAFIKRIKEGSIMASIEGVCVGDHIEKINGESVVGCRHFEVARRLKEVPKGEKFSLRIVEPIKAGFYNIGPSSGNRKSGGGNIGTGKKTVRLRSNGPATVEDNDDVIDIAVEKINLLLESFLGINDSELAQSIWEMGRNLNNPHEFALAIDHSDMGAFGFTDDFIFDLWGSITDAKQGRLKKDTNKAQEFNEQF